MKVAFQLELYGQWDAPYPSVVFRSVLNYPPRSAACRSPSCSAPAAPTSVGYIVNEFHGDTLVPVQLEDQVPVWKGITLPLTSIKLNVALAAFLDTGAVLERHPGGIAGATARAPNPTFADFHTGIGAGWRVLVPGVAIPALKVDVAYGLDVKDYAVTISVAGGGI